MRPKETTEETTKDDAANEKEGRRRLGSGLIVAFHAFVVAYAVFAVSFDHWGPLSDGCLQPSLLRRLAGLGIAYPGLATSSSSCGPYFPYSASCYAPRITEMACNERSYLRYVAVLDDQARAPRTTI
jgi:hypothetical protein